ncbi:MAG: hypothetical protein AAF629_06285 [Chloroflexota bacterium]
MRKATLRLFNAVQISEQATTVTATSVLERTIQHGYIFDPAINPTEAMLNDVEDVVGISGEKANAAFHKSWSVVQESSMEALVMHQIVHYLTTYGFRHRGIYREDTIYIPHETLNLPAVRKDIPLVVIKGWTAEELLAEIVKLGVGIALAKETIDDIVCIVTANNYASDFVQQIGNRELNALLCDFYELVPVEPVAYLRYVIGRLTGETLLIKNDALIEKIKEADQSTLDALLVDAPEDLASIFLRYKPLFLALKTCSSNKTFFNRLRKQADRLHQPLPEDYLNSVTAQLKEGRLDLDVLAQRLEKATVFRKIRLAYALNYRLHANSSTVYRVRNGRGWATEFDWPAGLSDATQQTLQLVLASLTADIAHNVTGKMIYIPASINYALPATEKQFTGHLPTGTSVVVPEDMIVGIHWINTDKPVDLDLSVVNLTGKIGWDAAYRSEERDILFSGDITDAPAPMGASELFYLKTQVQPSVMMVNYFNFEKDDEVDAKLLVAHEKPASFAEGYMVDINNIVASANINISKKQNVLGLIANVGGQNRFYFANVSIGNSISAADNEQTTHSRNYLVDSLVNTIDFKTILQSAGATVVDNQPENGDYLDLSPSALGKTSIIDLVQACK